MEKEINIAEILKDVPKETMLYSSTCGECKLSEVKDLTSCDYPIIIRYLDNDGYYSSLSLTAQGHEYDLPNVECQLFPSKSMRDWRRFGWKKGDVLVSDSGRKEIIFDHYTDDYFKFVGRHLLITDEEGCRYSTDKITLVTEMFSLEEKDAAQCYVNTLQRMLHSKLNKDTLELEKKEEYILKPFDKVLVRDSGILMWKCSIFSHMEGDRYRCIDFSWGQCIPYEGNEHLLCTTKNPDEK